MEFLEHVSHRPQSRAPVLPHVMHKSVRYLRLGLQGSHFSEEDELEQWEAGGLGHTLSSVELELDELELEEDCLQQEHELDELELEHELVQLLVLPDLHSEQ